MVDYQNQHMLLRRQTHKLSAQQGTTLEIKGKPRLDLDQVLDFTISVN